MTVYNNERYAILLIPEKHKKQYMQLLQELAQDNQTNDHIYMYLNIF